ncbi:mechanosensitive ion channel family protein [Candidatus Woesearchaeota archaeon]|nr:mechanosensitive ion channel family protein [Candidatus Woesearchaeota archaeon]
MVLELLNNITTNKYLHSLIILIAFFIMSELVVLISQKIILRLTKKTKTEVDDLIVSKTSKPLSLILLLVGLRLAIIPHPIKPQILDIFEHSLSSLIIAIVTYIVIIVLDILISNWGEKFASRTESKFDDEVVVLFQRFSRIVLSFVGLIFILQVWGVQVGPLLASLGIAGLAVAFALQSTLGNIFGGISLIVDRSITVNDFIKLDDNTQGFVLDIGLRSTKIRSIDGDLIIMPNGKLADSKIYNYHQPMPTTRVTVDFAAEYGSDAEKIKKIVLNELSNMKLALKEPSPQVLFDQLGEFALQFKALFWVISIEKRAEAKEAATAAIYNALNKNKIKIPFPTRTIYMKDSKEEK